MEVASVNSNMDDSGGVVREITGHGRIQEHSDSRVPPRRQSHSLSRSSGFPPLRQSEEVGSLSAKETAAVHRASEEDALLTVTAAELVVSALARAPEPETLTMWAAADRVLAALARSSQFALPQASLHHGGPRKMNSEVAVAGLLPRLSKQGVEKLTSKPSPKRREAQSLPRGAFGWKPLLASKAVDQADLLATPLRLTVSKLPVLKSEATVSASGEEIADMVRYNASGTPDEDEPSIQIADLVSEAFSLASEYADSGNAVTPLPPMLKQLAPVPSQRADRPRPPDWRRYAARSRSRSSERYESAGLFPERLRAGHLPTIPPTPPKGERSDDDNYVELARGRPIRRRSPSIVAMASRFEPTQPVDSTTSIPSHWRITGATGSRSKSSDQTLDRSFGRRATSCDAASIRPKVRSASVDRFFSDILPRRSLSADQTFKVTGSGLTSEGLVILDKSVSLDMYTSASESHGETVAMGGPPVGIFTSQGASLNGTQKSSIRILRPSTKHAVELVTRRKDTNDSIEQNNKPLCTDEHVPKGSSSASIFSKTSGKENAGVLSSIERCTRDRGTLSSFSTLTKMEDAFLEDCVGRSSVQNSPCAVGRSESINLRARAFERRSYSVDRNCERHSFSVDRDVGSSKFGRRSLSVDRAEVSKSLSAGSGRALDPCLGRHPTDKRSERTPDEIASWRAERKSRRARINAINAKIMDSSSKENGGILKWATRWYRKSPSGVIIPNIEMSSNIRSPNILTKEVEVTVDFTGTTPAHYSQRSNSSSISESLSQGNVQDIPCNNALPLSTRTASSPPEDTGMRSRSEQRLKGTPPPPQAGLLGRDEAHESARARVEMLLSLSLDAVIDEVIGSQIEVEIEEVKIPSPVVDLKHALDNEIEDIDTKLKSDEPPMTTFFSPNSARAVTSIFSPQAITKLKALAAAEKARLQKMLLQPIARCKRRTSSGRRLLAEEVARIQAKKLISNSCIDFESSYLHSTERVPLSIKIGAVAIAATASFQEALCHRKAEVESNVSGGCSDHLEKAKRNDAEDDDGLCQSGNLETLGSEFQRRDKQIVCDRSESANVLQWEQNRRNEDLAFEKGTVTELAKSRRESEQRRILPCQREQMESLDEAKADELDLEKELHSKDEDAALEKAKADELVCGIEERQRLQMERRRQDEVAALEKAKSDELARDKEELARLRVELSRRDELAIHEKAKADELVREKEELFRLRLELDRRDEIAALEKAKAEELVRERDYIERVRLERYHQVEIAALQRAKVDELARRKDEREKLQVERYRQEEVAALEKANADEITRGKEELSRLKVELYRRDELAALEKEKARTRVTENMVLEKLRLELLQREQSAAIAPESDHCDELRHAGATSFAEQARENALYELIAKRSSLEDEKRAEIAAIAAANSEIEVISRKREALKAKVEAAANARRNAEIASDQSDARLDELAERKASARAKSEAAARLRKALDDDENVLLIDSRVGQSDEMKQTNEKDSTLLNEHEFEFDFDLSVQDEVNGFVDVDDCDTNYAYAQYDPDSDSPCRRRMLATIIETHEFDSDNDEPVSQVELDDTDEEDDDVSARTSPHNRSQRPRGISSESTDSSPHKYNRSHVDVRSSEDVRGICPSGNNFRHIDLPDGDISDQNCSFEKLSQLSAEDSSVFPLEIVLPPETIPGRYAHAFEQVSTWRRSRSFGEKDLIEEEGAEPSPAFAESNHRVLTYRSDLTINSGISNAHASVSFSNYPRAQSGMESECLSTTTLGTQLEECVVDEISEVTFLGSSVVELFDESLREMAEVNVEGIFEDITIFSVAEIEMGALASYDDVHNIPENLEVVSAAVFVQCWLRKIWSRQLRVVIWIQRNRRSILLRRKFLACRRIVIITQACWRKNVAKRVNLQHNIAVVLIQAAVRRHACLKTRRMAMHAVVLLQKTMRGLSSKRVAIQKIVLVRHIQSFFRMCSASWILKRSRYAAVFLQSAVRAHSAIVFLARARRAACKIQGLLRARQAFSQYHSLRTHAIKMQAASRCARSRRSYVCTKSAIVVLQSALRMWASKKLLVVWAAAVSTLKRFLKVYICQRRYRRQLYALRKIQTRVRKNISVRAERFDAIVLFQCYRRQRSALRYVSNRRRALIVLQSSFRRLNARRSFLSTIRRIIFNQNLIRRWLATRIRLRILWAVICIQASRRSQLARSFVLKLRSTRAETNGNHSTTGPSTHTPSVPTNIRSVIWSTALPPKPTELFEFEKAAIETLSPVSFFSHLLSEGGGAQQGKKRRLSAPLIPTACTENHKGNVADRKDYQNEDVATAARLYMLADAGDAYAQFQLGLLCKLGLGVAKSDLEAARWHRLAAGGLDEVGLESGRSGGTLMFNAVATSSDAHFISAPTDISLAASSSAYISATPFVASAMSAGVSTTPRPTSPPLMLFAASVPPTPLLKGPLEEPLVGPSSLTLNQPVAQKMWRASDMALMPPLLDFCALSPMALSSIALPSATKSPTRPACPLSPASSLRSTWAAIGFASPGSLSAIGLVSPSPSFSNMSSPYDQLSQKLEPYSFSHLNTFGSISSHSPLPLLPPVPSPPPPPQSTRTSGREVIVLEPTAASFGLERISSSPTTAKPQIFCCSSAAVTPFSAPPFSILPSLSLDDRYIDLIYRPTVARRLSSEICPIEKLSTTGPSPNRSEDVAFTIVDNAQSSKGGVGHIDHFTNSSAGFVWEGLDFWSGGPARSTLTFLSALQVAVSMRDTDCKLSAQSFKALSGEILGRDVDQGEFEELLGEVLELPTDAVTFEVKEIDRALQRAILEISESSSDVATDDSAHDSVEELSDKTESNNVPALLINCATIDEDQIGNVVDETNDLSLSEGGKGKGRTEKVEDDLNDIECRLTTEKPNKSVTSVFADCCGGYDRLMPAPVVGAVSALGPVMDSMPASFSKMPLLSVIKCNGNDIDVFTGSSGRHRCKSPSPRSKTPTPKCRRVETCLEEGGASVELSRDAGRGSLEVSDGFALTVDETILLAECHHGRIVERVASKSCELETDSPTRKSVLSTGADTFETVEDVEAQRSPCMRDDLYTSARPTTDSSNSSSHSSRWSSFSSSGSFGSQSLFVLQRSLRKRTARVTGLSGFFSGKVSWVRDDEQDSDQDKNADESRL